MNKLHLFLSNPVLLIFVAFVLPTGSNESSNWEQQGSACKIGHGENSQRQHCKSGMEAVFISDSINFHFSEMDTDDTDYLFIDELAPHIKISSRRPLGDAEAVDRANKYLAYLDGNLDSVIDIYELRFSLHSIITGNLKLTKFETDPDFIYWLKSFVGENPRKYSFYLVKIFQVFDEDMNGKLTWKEIRMAIKTAELYKSVQEDVLMDERSREDLVASIKVHHQQKWINLEELWGLLYKLDVNSSDGDFYYWTINYLGGDSETKSKLVTDSTRKEFKDADLDSNGIITKGEITAILHKHRTNYYTPERINRRWTRADRNQDGKITFNEYAFLENLKHPQRK